MSLIDFSLSAEYLKVDRPAFNLAFDVPLSGLKNGFVAVWDA